jgi:hypothetical protein
VAFLQKLQLVVLGVKDFIACLALGDGHVRQDVPVVLVLEGRLPLGHDDLARLHVGEALSADHDRGKAVTVLLKLLIKRLEQFMIINIRLG